jgi:hypothetical protein
MRKLSWRRAIGATCVIALAVSRVGHHVIAFLWDAITWGRLWDVIAIAAMTTIVLLIAGRILGVATRGLPSIRNRVDTVRLWGMYLAERFRD